MKNVKEYVRNVDFVLCLYIYCYILFYFIVFVVKK